MAAESFEQMVAQAEAAADRFCNGDPGPLMALWSRSDDVPIFGGWGDFETGWQQVGPRLEWASSRFVNADMAYRHLNQGMSGDFAFTVGIEQGNVRLVGQEGISPMTLRVTTLYRRENGAWRIIHRHADPILEKTAPTAVLRH